MAGHVSAQTAEWSAQVESVLTKFEDSHVQQDGPLFLLDNEHPEVLTVAAGMFGVTLDEYRAYLRDSHEATKSVYEFGGLEIDRAAATYGELNGQPWAILDYRFDTVQQSNGAETVRTFCNRLMIYQETSEIYVSNLEAGVIYDLFAMARPDLAAVAQAPPSVCPS